MGSSSWFHVIDSKTTYNMLLGRPWIHANNVVPSTLHQCFKYTKNGVEKTVLADDNPFVEAEAHFVDAKYYTLKVKGSENPIKEEVTTSNNQKEDEVKMENGKTHVLRYTPKMQRKEMVTNFELVVIVLKGSHFLLLKLMQ
ncbi:hypothetical protein LIER_04019 [Lithospermum erythrorhizon]|uniref:Uncharacterized protein n=1 Tax=Lithospermum erythrorhizon TaxID=34254 RepID=A0AAV3NXZ4_LITER